MYVFTLAFPIISRAIKESKSQGSLKGVQISQHLSLTHLLFMDDVLIFCIGTMRDLHTLNDILVLFSKSTGMEINFVKSTLTTHVLSEEEKLMLLNYIPFNTSSLEGGLKYLGFHLKPNDYWKHDWKWLIEKLEKRLKIWRHKWLYRARRLVLVKAIMEVIPVY